jgi:hypothetical protein
MSVRVMTMVFERYPCGGGEMLIALALADHASDGGENIFPSIKALAEKTRQSERSVQYQLRKMESIGWLILVNSGNGGRNQRREYVIAPEWIKGAEIAPPLKGANDDIKGAEIAPFPAVKGAIHDTKGCNLRQERVHSIAPAYNHQGIIKEPSKEKTAHAQAPAPSLLIAGLPDGLLADFQKVRKAKRAGPLTDTAMKGLMREADKAGITLVEAVTACCEFGWQAFNAAWYADRKPKPDSKSNPKPALQNLTFAERDRIAGMQRWEESSNMRHPDLPQEYSKLRSTADVIDVTPQNLRIAK